MNSQHQQIENYFEFVKEIVQKTVELCQTRQANKEQQLQVNHKN